MQKKSFAEMNCSIAKSLDEIGEWWSLLIIREFTQGATRFDEIQSELGIARNILATRLARLIELGIVEKYSLEHRANTDGYRLTPKGEDLYPVIVALMQWGDRWTTSQGKPRTVLVEDSTGKPVERLAVHSKGGKPLSFRDVRYAPGPGARASTLLVIEKRNKLVLGKK